MAVPTWERFVEQHTLNTSNPSFRERREMAKSFRGLTDRLQPLLKKYEKRGLLGLEKNEKRDVKRYEAIKEKFTRPASMWPCPFEA